MFKLGNHRREELDEEKQKNQVFGLVEVASWLVVAVRVEGEGKILELVCCQCLF